MGNPDFYGRGSQYAVNTLEPMKVVTQFITSDGTDDGDLVEIKRFYVQNGNIIHSPSSTILGPDDTDSITEDFCNAKKDLFGDVKDYQELGGMKGMGESLDRGHVMIFSLWDDVEVNMLWLDSAYPLNKPVTDLVSSVVNVQEMKQVLLLGYVRTTLMLMSLLKTLLLEK